MRKTRSVTRRLHKGFTLVELMIVVAIVGVLATLSSYGVRRYISNAKTTEARLSVGQISLGAAVAFEKESGTQAMITTGATGSSLRTPCPSTTRVPVSAPRAQKYQSQKSDWSGDPGWVCLKFDMPQPQYYAYRYVSNVTSSSGSYDIYANGDLNGDLVESTISIHGEVQSGRLTNSPSLLENNPDE